MRTPPGLVSESEAWQRDGLITAEQRRAILARYEPAESAAQQASAILTWLAVIVAGIGGVVLIAWNWTAIPPVMKIVVSAGPMAGFYAAAALAAHRGRHVTAGRLALLAALAAGAALFVASDLFHVAPERTNTLLLWSGILAATAVLTPSAPIAAAGTAIGTWWMLIGGGGPPPPWWFLPVWAALAFAVERDRNRWVAGGVSLAFGFWAFFTVLDIWNDQPAAPAIAAVLAANWIYTLATAPEGRRPAFARATPALALTLLGLMLLLPSGSHVMTDWRLAADSIAPAVVLFAALAAATLGNVARSGAWRSRPAGLTIISIVWLAAWLTLPASLRAAAWLQWTWTAIFSGAMIHLGAAAVRDAARTRDRAQVIIGLVSVLALVVVRVVDARSLVVSGVMLLGFAALLWWLGRLWVRPGAPAPEETV